MNAIVEPRSSTPSKLTMHVSPSRLARSRTRARAPSRPYSSASGKSTPTPASRGRASTVARSEEHTSELQSPCNLVCRLLLEKKKNHLTRRDHQLSLGPPPCYSPPPRVHSGIPP